MNEIAIAVIATLFAAITSLLVRSSKKLLQARRTIKFEVRLPGDTAKTMEFGRFGDDEKTEMTVDDLLHPASAAPATTTAG